MFQAAKVNGSGYCGPTSLSAVTGVGTKEIAQTVRHYYPSIKRVCGLENMVLTKVLDHFGVKNRHKSCRGTLRSWVEDYRRPNTAYIVHVSSHYLVVYNDQVVCTQFGGKVGLLADSNYLRCRVSGFWMIESDPKKGVEIPVSEVVKRSSFKRKVIKICEKYDISFDDWEYRRSQGVSVIWMFLPQEMIKKHFGKQDPWYDDHHFDNYEECWDRLQEVLKVVEKQECSRV